MEISVMQKQTVLNIFFKDHYALIWWKKANSKLCESRLIPETLKKRQRENFMVYSSLLLEPNKQFIEIHNIAPSKKNLKQQADLATIDW